jgi:hypothetical protein
MAAGAGRGRGRGRRQRRRRRRRGRRWRCGLLDLVELARLGLVADEVVARGKYGAAAESAHAGRRTGVAEARQREAASGGSVLRRQDRCAPMLAGKAPQQGDDLGQKRIRDRDGFGNRLIGRGHANAVPRTADHPFADVVANREGAEMVDERRAAAVEEVRRQRGGLVQNRGDAASDAERRRGRFHAGAACMADLSADETQRAPRERHRHAP